MLKAESACFPSVIKVNKDKGDAVDFTKVSPTRHAHPRVTASCGATPREDCGATVLTLAKVTMDKES